MTAEDKRLWNCLRERSHVNIIDVESVSVCAGHCVESVMLKRKHLAWANMSATSASKYSYFSMITTSIVSVNYTL